MTDKATGIRRQHAEVRREQIIEAALQVFSEKGYAGASVREIARRVGVTEGLIYHYFESKEALMLIVLSQKSFSTQIEKVLEEQKDSSLDVVLRSLMNLFLKTLSECASTVRMSVAEMQKDSEISAIHSSRVEKDQQIITDFLRVRQDLGEVRRDADVSMAAALLLGATFSFFLLWNRLEPALWEIKTKAFVNGGVELLLNGLVAR